MDKMDNKQEQLDNVSTEMEILRKNQRKMLKTKNAVTERNNHFNGLIKVQIDEERISELEDVWIDTSKTDKQTEKKA